MHASWIICLHLDSSNYRCQNLYYRFCRFENCYYCQVVKHLQSEKTSEVPLTLSQWLFTSLTYLIWLIKFYSQHILNPIWALTTLHNPPIPVFNQPQSHIPRIKPETWPFFVFSYFRFLCYNLVFWEQKILKSLWNTYCVFWEHIVIRKCIVCIGISTPLKITTPSCQVPLKSANCPSSPFLGSSPLLY